MNLKSIYYESSHIQIIPDQNQISYLGNQFYGHNVIYNTLLDKVLQDYSKTHTLQYNLTEWSNYISSLFRNNPIWPGILQMTDPLVVNGTFSELNKDLQYHFNINNMATCPEYKNFDMNTYQSIWIDVTTSLNDIKSSKLYINLPGLGETRINTIIKPDDGVSSRIFAIQIYGNLSENTFSLILHKEVISNKVALNHHTTTAIGVYLDNNLPYEIALSNGTVLTAPEYLLSNIEDYLAQKENNDKVISLENKIIRQRNLWFYQVATDLLEKYKVIIFEHQPRFPGNTMINAGWIQFIGELYKQSQKYSDKCKLIGIVPDPNRLTTCSFCGHHSSFLGSTYESEWNCPRCYAPLKTNVNAARNILKAGLKKI